jgi:hypothetical protein
MVKSEYLHQGKQTILTDRVMEHAEKAKATIINDGNKAKLDEPLLSIHKTSKYISTLNYYDNLDFNKLSDKEFDKLKIALFRKRTVDEILDQGLFPTCSDIGVVFRGLMIAQNHPTSYVESFHEFYLLKGVFHTHSLGRVFLEDDSSYIVDPKANPIIYKDEFELFDLSKYIIFKEGLDSWYIGITDYSSLNLLKNDNLSSLLNKYEDNLKVVFRRKMDDLNIFRENLSQ